MSSEKHDDDHDDVEFRLEEVFKFKVLSFYSVCVHKAREYGGGKVGGGGAGAAQADRSVGETSPFGGLLRRSTLLPSAA